MSTDGAIELRRDTMGRHHEDDPARRTGGLRWKGDTSADLPVLGTWATHEGISEDTVNAFVNALHSSNPPGTDLPAEHARYAWLIERCSDRFVSGEPVRAASWVTMASGFTDVSYPDARACAEDVLMRWLAWNDVDHPEVRRLHIIWTRHATEGAWSERLEGR